MLSMFHQSARYWLFQFLVFFFIVISGATVHAAQVTLAWDPGDSVSDGYKVFQRTEGEAYDYSSPVWPQSGDDATQTACTISNLNDSVNYYFLIRAYVGGEQNGDSNEVLFRSDPPVIETYTLAVSAGANGSISPDTVTVNAGESQTFTISANSHYHIADVTVDGVSVGAVASFTFDAVSADHTISAVFAADTYTITASAADHGSISPSGAASVVYGESISYTITADTGYHVQDVLVDGQSVGAVSLHTFSQVNANHTISAVFAAGTFTITASAADHGSISPSGAASVVYGASISYTITADTGYHVQDVLVDGQSVGAVSLHTFSQVNANHTISAAFTANAFVITASAGTGGTITPSGAVSVSSGGNQTFYISADQGHEIASLVVDGVPLSGNGAPSGSSSAYTFVSVSAAHTISAQFKSVNQSPVADAGPDQVVDEAQTVTLSGLNSHDPDDGIASFQWRQTQGTLVTLSSYEEDEVTFTAPDVDVAGQALVFELTVTDSYGAVAKDSCIVNVTWVNAAPTADAGMDQSISEGSAASLSATASTDPDDGIVGYQWLQLQGPQVTLSDALSATPTFTAPEVGPEGVSLTFQITVTDAGGLQDTDTCNITVTWDNSEPVADAGQDQETVPGAEVTLDGTGSVDPDGSALLYKWRQTDGSPVVLSDATAAQPVFTVPAEGFNDILLVFELTVTDEYGLQGVDTCKVLVNAQAQVSDTNPPELVITNPVIGNTTNVVEVNSSSITIDGIASDDNDVDRVVWLDDRGKSGEAEGTDAWHFVHKLHRWQNSLTITAYDSAGNYKSKTIIIMLKVKR